MPSTKPDISVKDVLAKYGYGYMFRNPFVGEYTRDPKSAYASAWDCYDKMLAWDPELAALDKLARFAVLSHDTEIVAATEDAESDKAADFCREMISAISNWDDILYDLLDSPAKGLAIVQKNFVRDGAYWTVAETTEGEVTTPALQTLPQHWFYWKLVDGVPRLIFRGLYGGVEERAIDPEFFIIARHGYTVENPYGRGYLTDCFWNFAKKNILDGYLIQLIERGVEPERWAQCTPDELGAKAWDQKDEIRQALYEFARHSDMTLPPGVALNYQTGDSGAMQSEINLAHRFDNYHAKVILGQTLTTDQGRTGSYELGKIHELQQARLTIARCKDQMADMNDQLLTPLCELNFNVGRAKWKIKYEPEDDRKDQAERIKMLAEKYDLRLPAKWLHYAQGFPEPEDAEEIYIPRGGGGGGAEFGGGGFGFAEGQKKNLILATPAERQREANRRGELINAQVARHVALSKGIVNKRLAAWEKLINKSKSYEDLTARVESRSKKWPEFADALRKAAVASYALGMVTQAQETPLVLAVTAPPTYDTWDEVMRDFRDKVAIPAEIFYSLDVELRAKFFATALAEDEYMATVLHNLTSAAIEGGESFAWFKEGAYQAMRAGGYEFPEPYRLMTVYQRHIATANAAALDEWWSQPEIDEMIWGYEYMRTTSAEPRLDHLQLVGTRLPKADLFWATCSPPNGYG